MTRAETPTDTAAAGNGAADREPTEIEALLPFHAAGTLGLRDARRVEEALAADPELARQYAVIQDEFTETILLNESLGAPSARAMQKLFAAIDAEPAARTSFNPLMKIAGFFSSLSPRTLAYAGIAAACVVLVQTGVIGTVLVKDRAGGTFETAAFPAQPAAAGTFALVRFAPDASAADITRLLDAYDASIVSGPKAGMFRVRFSDKVLSKQEAEQLLARVQAEKIVSLVAVTD